MLIIASTDLQKEIVEGGRVSHRSNVEKLVGFCLFGRKRTTNQTKSTNFIVQGAATIKEFYAKNSRWTEGLISAAKAVGWGATEMV